MRLNKGKKENYIEWDIPILFNFLASGIRYDVSKVAFSRPAIIFLGSVPAFICDFVCGGVS